MIELTDDDGVDGPFERFVRSAERDDRCRMARRYRSAARWLVERGDLTACELAERMAQRASVLEARP